MKGNREVRVSSYLAAALAAVLCAMLLLRGEAVRRGALDGLRVCGEVIIPSLYLFMAVAGFIAQSDAGELLSRPLSPLTRRVFRLPACMGAAIVLSCVGGYPVGAKTIASLLDGGKITRGQAERALCFCCNAGPSFVVTAVGAGMLGSAAAGGILLAAHLGSALLLGALLALREPVVPKTTVRGTALPLPEAFITGVNQATTGILSICAFVVFFSAFGALLDDCGLSALMGGETGRCVVVGLLEVTSGCIGAAALPGRWPLLLIPVFVSFAGGSILFQVRAILAGRGLRFGRFFLCRVLHAGLTLLFSYPFLAQMNRSIGAFANQLPPVGYHTPNTPLVTTLLLLTSGCLLLRMTRKG